jgi:hypothetical protein
VYYGHYFDWQRAGLPNPPFTFTTQFTNTMQSACFPLAESLFYVRRFEAYSRIVCINRSRMMSIASCIHPIRFAAPALQLSIYYPTAASADAEHLPRLTHAQQLLLLCSSSHACHLAHVLLMPRNGRRFNKDPRKALLQRMFDEGMVMRLVMLGLQ